MCKTSLSTPHRNPFESDGTNNVFKSPCVYAKYPTNPQPIKNIRKISKQITSVQDRFDCGPLNDGSYRSGSPERIRNWDSSYFLFLHEKKSIDQVCDWCISKRILLSKPLCNSRSCLLGIGVSLLELPQQPIFYCFNFFLYFVHLDIH